MNWDRNLINVFIFMLVGIIVIITLGVRSSYAEQENACHTEVYKRAKNSATILTTESRGNLSTKSYIFGKAQLQNGFGANTNYTYECNMTGNYVSIFELKKGY